jgi:hypothetical protein
VLFIAGVVLVTGGTMWAMAGGWYGADPDLRAMLTIEAHAQGAAPTKSFCYKIVLYPRWSAVMSSILTLIYHAYCKARLAEMGKHGLGGWLAGPCVLAVIVMAVASWRTMGPPTSCSTPVANF